MSHQIAGFFKVSSNRVDRFYSQRFERMLILVGFAFQLPLTFLILFYHKDSSELLAIPFILVFLLIICFSSIKAARTSATYESTIISIDKTCIKRSGKNLTTVSIDFKNIYRVIEQKDGLILIEEWSKTTFLLRGRYTLINEPGILFIPSMITDFEKLRDYFINEEYKGVINKDK